VRKRTAGREAALKILYEHELRKESAEELLREYFEENEAGSEIRKFTELLVKGTLERLEAIDSILRKYADNWDLKRMAVIDRNILRFSVFELVFLEDIPPKVTINEAVNIAKKYSQEQSGKFVNGILDKINHTEPKRTGAPISPPSN
jgi:N utilization substance protein B